MGQIKQILFPSHPLGVPAGTMLPGPAARDTLAFGPALGKAPSPGGGTQPEQGQAKSCPALHASQFAIAGVPKMDGSVSPAPWKRLFPHDRIAELGCLVTGQPAVAGEA